MERKSININFVMVLACFAITLSACGKWDDIHRQFVGDGEIAYTGKADSVRIRSGLNRLELSWLLVSDPKVTKYKVYWNNRQDSLSKDVQRSTKVDTVRLMFDNLKEGTYHFEIYTFDAEGNSSVKSEAVGKVYGEQFQRELLTRAFRSSIRSGKDRLIEWISADEMLIGSELVYKNGQGQQIEKYVDKKDERTLLEDIPLAGSFTIRSLFLPDPMALDTFYTHFEPVNYDYTWVDWRDVNVVFGYNGSLISIDKDGFLRHAAHNAVGGAPMYDQARQIGNGWNIFATVFPNRNTLIGWFKSEKAVMRYNFDNSSVTFTDSRMIASSGWDAFNLVFPFQGDILAREALSSKLYRYGMDPSENFSGLVTEIIGSDPWGQYTLLASSGAFLYGKTSDGKLWRIPITGNSAGPRHLEADNWQDIVFISVHGHDLLAKKANGELWQFPVSSGGDLGNPIQVKVPLGEKQRLN